MKRNFALRPWLPLIIVAMVLLAALPAALTRIAHTRSLYLFSKQFFEDMVARLSGPGRLRFILQPAMAIVIGARHGLRDAHQHLPPFVWALVFEPGQRRKLLGNAIARIRNLIAIAILLDVVSQLLILHRVHPAAALLLGPVLIAIPYSVARAFANRLVQSRASHAQLPRSG